MSIYFSNNKIIYKHFIYDLRSRALTKSPAVGIINRINF